MHFWAGGGAGTDLEQSDEELPAPAAGAAALGASAIRKATLTHAARAKEQLAREYEQPFRILPPTKEEHVIAEVDGTMICTVEKGPRKGQRPRE